MKPNVKPSGLKGKQATLLDGLDVSPLTWHVCVCGSNQFVHEGMNHISNVEVHLKTCSGDVNISLLISRIVSRSVLHNINTFMRAFYIFHSFGTISCN